MQSLQIQDTTPTSKEGETYQYQSISFKYAAERENEFSSPSCSNSTLVRKKRSLIGLLAIVACLCTVALSFLYLDQHRHANDVYEARAPGEVSDAVNIRGRGGEEGMAPLPLMGDATSSCEDIPNWVDENNHGCDWYKRRFAPGCATLGQKWKGAMGLASDGCCLCGGGRASVISDDSDPTVEEEPDTNKPPPPPPEGPTSDPAFNCPDNKPFQITLVNTGSNTNFDKAFSDAKDRWESIIKCGLEDERPYSAHSDWFTNKLSRPHRGVVDDVVIGYEFIEIDGSGSVKENGKFANAIGQARPTRQRGTGSTISGIMQFDEYDFARESEENAKLIILHEMGHVLGLVNTPGTDCYTDCDITASTTIISPRDGCTKTVDEYEKLNLGVGPLQLKNRGRGRDGMTCGHWAESSFPDPFTDELLTPGFDPKRCQTISRVTVAALDQAATDYVVDYSAADPYPYASCGDLLRPTSSFTVEADVDDESLDGSSGNGRRLFMKRH